MRIELWGELVLEDLDGKVLYRKREKSRSFVRAWLHLLYGHITGLGIATPDINGTNRTIVEYATNFQIDGYGGTSFGIVFGTGDTAVDVSDYGMEALIAAGEAAGQFQYCWNEVSERVVVGADCYFTVTRRAFNLSGGDITVAEWGLYARMWAGSNYYMCAVRDVPGAPLLVPTATVLTGVYTLKITV